MRRHRLTAGLLGLLLAAVLPVTFGAGSASASTRQFTTFEAPAELLGDGDATRQATLSQLQQLGVTAIRIELLWAGVAPSPDARTRPHFDQTDPAAYGWGGFGTLADEAHARGMRVLLTVGGPVPIWATAARRDHLTNPVPGDYKAFMTAVGRRFASDVYAYSVWNEPNLSKFLAPQFGPNGKLLSPALYRSLFFSGVDGLRAAGVKAAVLAGEMEPVGNSIAIAPMRFLRAVLCLNGSYKPVKRCSRLPAAGWSVHPYMRPVFPTTAPPGPDDVTIGGLGRLVHGLDLAARAGMVSRRLGVYATEFGVQSYPNRVAGLPLAKQSDYRSVAEYLAWSNPRVTSFSQYLLTDPPPVPGPASSRYVFQMGLYLYGGRPKPAYDSFRLPLVVRRAAHGRVSLWGLVRPDRALGAPGVVSVQYEDSARGGWRPLLNARFGSSGYWTARAAFKSSRHWRVQWTNAAGQTFSGPATAAYAF